MPELLTINVTQAAATSPLTYTVPASVEVQALSAFAHFDGTAAAAPFLAALTFKSASGLILARVFSDTQVAAGGTADVTFAPFLGNAVNAAAVIGATTVDDYVFKFSNTTVTGVGFNSQTNLIIQGNAVTLDGNTRVKVEFFTPCVEIDQGDNNQACGFELWDGTTNVGTMAYVVGNTNNAVSQLLNSVKAEVILTPSAGTHTYAVYAWKNIAADSVIVYANTFVDGSGNFSPAWYRVTQT